jgi:topoisomerase-4 subunit A
MVDLPNEAEIVDLFVHQPGTAADGQQRGRRLRRAEDEIVAQTRTGKQVLNVREGVTARVCKPDRRGRRGRRGGREPQGAGLPLDEVPEMGRGKGVRLQKYKDGGLSDARTFTLAEGLSSWLDPAGRTRTETDLAEWTGKRASEFRRAAWRRAASRRDNRFT